MKKSNILKIPKKSSKSKESELIKWQNKLKELPWKPNAYPARGNRFTPSGGDKQKIHEAVQEKKENYGFGKYVLNTKRLGTWGNLGKKITNTIIGDPKSKTRRYKKQQ